ncbi:MAG TPA: NAD(P)/FAD-dependent oxidoreductase [Solirubrobacteraceae bacterium]|nr:NAD(P)/FAD-dependent oxidoreductase [Solirubrobacteraceae bacterium]
MHRNDVLIIGAGPCGVASALALRDVGLRPLVLDRADRVAAAWRSRYDRLRLNTARPLSHLPDRRFTKGTPMFPTRDHVIEHVERYAAEGGLEFRFGTRVERLTRGSGGWVAHTPDGELAAPQAIVATGRENEPVLPDCDGRDRFRGRLLHSAEYRNAEPFEGDRVLVVGAGSSGMEIAHDLAVDGAAKVWLAARTPPNIMLREAPGGIPGDMLAVVMMHLPIRVGDAIAGLGRRTAIGDLSDYGLPVPDEGVMSRLHRLGVAPAIVDMEVIDAIRAREIEVVPAVQSLDSARVKLSDGSSVEADAIICATGYRCGLESMVGHLGVLDERGRPKADGEKPAAPGLRFIGYVPRPGGLGYAAKQAKRAAKAIASELRGSA